MNEPTNLFSNSLSPAPATSAMDHVAPALEPTRPTFPPANTVEEGCEQAFHYAAELYNKTPDWVTFFREVLGVGGMVRQLFPTAAAMTEFENSAEHMQIQQMLTKLRERPQATAEDKEPTRVITVRMPKSLHESLRAEAHNRRTSMNKLCISKLLQVIDGEFVPDAE